MYGSLVLPLLRSPALGARQRSSGSTSFGAEKEH
jgi:hypothetical protein